MTAAFRLLFWSFLVCAQPALSAPRIIDVGCPSISVRSLEKSVAFYTGKLDFKLLEKTDSSAMARLSQPRSPTLVAHSAKLTLVDECLTLTEYSSPRGRDFPADSRANDRWFEHIAIVVSNMNAAYQRLQTAHVQMVSLRPQTLPASNPDAAGISALYFRDPDGHYLELIHFPTGKGQMKWQKANAPLFEGIDHTAIAVGNTDRSLTFYRDFLHLHVVGHSNNFGVEQEKLSGVSNANVRITSLRGFSGIGIELLEYLTPSDGRPIPGDQKLDDIASWQINAIVTMSANDSRAVEGTSPLHWRAEPMATDKSRKVAWVKDPDGHDLKLTLLD